MIIFLIIIFMFGLVCGSFAGALVYRYGNGYTISQGYSYCEECKHRLYAKNLIPLFSFILQKGKCAYCKTNISYYVLVIELAVAILFTAFAYYYGMPITLLSWLVFAVILLLIMVNIAILFADYKYYIIPDKLLYLFLPLAVFIKLYAQNFSINSVILPFIFPVLFYLIWRISQGKYIGFGDVKYMVIAAIALPISLMMSWFLQSIALALIVSIVLLLFKKKNLKTQLPFGVFMSLSFILVLFIGDLVWRYYVKLFIL